MLTHMHTESIAQENTNNQESNAILPQVVDRHDNSTPIGGLVSFPHTNFCRRMTIIQTHTTCTHSLEMHDHYLDG